MIWGCFKKMETSKWLKIELKLGFFRGTTGDQYWSLFPSLSLVFYWCFEDVMCCLFFLGCENPNGLRQKHSLESGFRFRFLLEGPFFWHHNFEPEQSLSNLYSARIFHYKPSGYWGSPIYGNPVRFVAWIPLGNGHLPNWEMIYPMKTTNLQL